MSKKQLDRLEALEQKNSSKEIHVITTKDYINETFEEALSRYKKENGIKVLSEEDVVHIHWISDWQKREEKLPNKS